MAYVPTITLSDGYDYLSDADGISHRPELSSGQ